MPSIRFAALVAALALASSAAASGASAAVTYHFSIDTSTLAGANGFIELQFANGGGGAGVVAQEATATISGFATDGVFTEADPYSASDLFGAPNIFGQVSGILPGPVVMSGITTNFDDYLQSLQFGAAIGFNLTLSGPAIDTPACGAFSTCSLPGFTLDFLNADGSQYLLTADQAQFYVAQVNGNRDGSATPVVFPNAGGASAITITAVPEPTAWALMMLGFAGLGAALRHRRQAAFG